MTATTEIFVPDIGEAKNVEVVEVLVEVGQEIGPDDPVITIETDKSVMEVPTNESGVIAELKVSEGDKVSQGDLILLIRGAAEGSEAADSKPSEAAPKAEQPESVSAKPDSAQDVAPAAESNAAEPEADASAEAVMDIAVPDLGGQDSVEVVEVLVAAGDEVAVDQPLVTVETDKAVMEIPASNAGVVVELKVAEGDKVSQGDIVLSLRGAAASNAKATVSEAKAEIPETDTAAPKAVETAPAAPEQSGASVTTGNAHAGPAVRRIAGQYGVDLSQVTGTGRKGRILKHDVQAYVKQRLSQPASAAGAGPAVAPLPEIDFSKFGEVTREPLSNIKRRTGENMHRSWSLVPHVTHFDKADITELEAFRQKANAERREDQPKLTILPLLMLACAKQLQAMPQFNSSLSADGSELIMKQYVHIGVAVDTPNGLMVPVVKDVPGKGLYQIAEDVVELAGKAKKRKLTADAMQGGCFSISSLGHIGGTAFTPIVNTPEVAILGVTKASMEPVWDGNAFEPRLMLPLSLSYDHRVIDGVAAAQFAKGLAAFLEDPRRLLL